jgi:hypothetical protein
MNPDLQKKKQRSFRGIGIESKVGPYQGKIPVLIRTNQHANLQGRKWYTFDHSPFLENWSQKKSSSMLRRISKKLMPILLR